MGLVMFWTLEMGSLLVIVHFANEFFGGALVPLWLFPDWLRAVAEALPFQGEAYIPLAIYFGRLDGAGIVRGLLVQAFWVVALSAIALLVWRRAERRVIVQGG
jgi:ABC-type uncharacterized transport system permease subunit